MAPPADNAPPAPPGNSLRATGPQVLVEGKNVRVRPGELATAPVRIRNRSAIVQEYFFDVLGPAKEWASVTPRTVSLFPGDESTVSVAFAPPTSWTVAPGARPYAIRATSTVDPTATATDEGTLDVERFTQVSASVAPLSATLRLRANYHLQIANRGNTPVAIAVGADDPQQRLNFRWGAKDQVELPPGQRVQMPVKVSTSPIMRAPMVHNFAFIVRGVDTDIAREGWENLPELEEDPAPAGHARVALNCVAVQNPIVGKWVLRALIAAAILLVVGILYLAEIKPQQTLQPVPDGPPNPPYQVVATAANPSTITLAWIDAGGATGYQVFERPPDANSPGGATTTTGPQPGQADVVSKCAGCKQVATVPAGSTRFDVGNLAAGTTFCFQMVALRDKYSSDFSNTACAITPAALALCVPTGLKVVPDPTGTSAVLGWQPGNPDGCNPGPATGFQVARNLGVGLQVVANAGTGDSAVTIKDLVPGTNYCYAVATLVDKQTSAFSPELCFVAPVPVPPSTTTTAPTTPAASTPTTAAPA